MIQNGRIRYRMDRSDLEPDRGVLCALTGLHELLCHAHGGTLAGHGYEEIRGHDA